MGFSALCRLKELSEGSSRRFEAGGREIALFRCEAGVFAVDDLCTHARARLSEGTLDRARCTVECPLHGAEFDLRSGTALTPPATAAAGTYPVRVREGIVEVDVGETPVGEDPTAGRSNCSS